MTYQKIIDYVRVNIDDTKATRYEDIDMFILSALRKVFNKLISNGYNPSVVDATITITDQLTDLDTSPYKILAVQDTFGNSIDIVEESKARRSRKRVCFFRIGTGGVNKIGWYVDITSNIDLVYQYMPKPTSSIGDKSATDISIPEEHHDLVVLWATVLALSSDEDNPGTFVQLYQDAENTMVESLVERNPRVVKTKDWF